MILILSQNTDQSTNDVLDWIIESGLKKKSPAGA